MQGSKISPAQCAFVATPEIERICKFIAEQIYTPYSLYRQVIASILP